MAELGLNESHEACMASYLRFCKYQRVHRIRSVDACFQDVKDTRLVEDTYTSEEVEEVLDALSDVVRAEVEGELIHATHTNSLLLSKLFTQAQKWHLALTVDTSDLENQELLEQIKKFEDTENQGRSIDRGSTKARTLAPLTEAGGPTALLNAQIQALTKDNAQLKDNLEEAELRAVEATKSRTELATGLQEAKDEILRLKNTISRRPTSDEVTELSDEVEKMRLELVNQTTAQETNQEHLTHDLQVSRQTLLQVKAQLALAEKELEKKFSQTGAYQNMKKMLNKKNEQIKAMRKKLESYEPDTEDVIEE